MGDTGFVLCTSGVEVSGANTSWTTPGNITADDGSYATSALGFFQLTNDLKGSNFGLSVPSAAVVTSVTVRFQVKSSSAVQNTFFGVNIGKSDAVQGNGNSTATTLTTSDVNYDTVGGDGGLLTFGLTLTGADVNASTFQVRGSWIDTGVTGTISVDAAWVRILYNDVSASRPFRTTSDLRFR